MTTYKHFSEHFINLHEDFSLVIIKNESLLDSIKDYFYENLLHDFDDDRLLHCEIESIDSTLDKVKTKWVMVIEEGMFFKGHIDNDFLRRHVGNLEQSSLIGHVLDRKERYYQLHPQHFILNVDDWQKAGSPRFLCKQDHDLAGVQRSPDNFHDDYTPISVSYDKNNSVKCDKLKFGGKVISEMLKNNFAVRPFNEEERQRKKFVYHDISEQVPNLLNWDHLPTLSYYYAMATHVSEKQFTKKHPTYISVANGIESLRRIKNVYKSINHIKYYDVSITALIFTELLITKFENNFKEFVKKFEQELGARPWTALHVEQQEYRQLDQYESTVKEVMPIIEHIRTNNVKVDYCYGDITRIGVIRDITTDSLISLTNVFNYERNHIRKSEFTHWRDAIKNHKLNKFDIEFLR